MTLENLATEILLEIFDYLRPSDFFQSFSVLNERFERLIRLKTNVHLDLSTNLSLNDFQRLSRLVVQRYSSTISSIRLSNVETCGNLRSFLQEFSPIEQTFPRLVSIDVTQPNVDEFKQIFTSNHFQRISVKFHRFNEQNFPIDILFTSPQLETCRLITDDILLVTKLRFHPNLKHLTLHSFCINDLHILFDIFPSLTHLTIGNLSVNFQGFLPPFRTIYPQIQSIDFNCFFTVRFDYLVYVLSYFPQLIRLSFVAVGRDFLQSERLIELFENFPQLRSLRFDLKGIVNDLTEDFSLSFDNEFWRRWPIQIDYSQDNGKVHLFTLPYRFQSFIGTIYTRSIVSSSSRCFDFVKDLYLKSNASMETNVKRFYPNVRALQIYQNNPISIHPVSLYSQIQSTIDLSRLIHFELFVVLPTSIFLDFLRRTSALKYFKTDYRILLTLTDDFQHNEILFLLGENLDQLVIRRDPMPMSDANRFLQIFGKLKHLKIVLTSIDDLRFIANKFVQSMKNLQTLLIALDDSDIDKAKWEGVMNNISYEVGEKYIRIWK